MDESLFNQIMWWGIVVMWFFFCQRMSNAQNLGSEGRLGDDMTEEEEETRKDFILHTLVIKEIISPTSNSDRPSTFQSKEKAEKNSPIVNDKSVQSGEITVPSDEENCVDEDKDGSAINTTKQEKKGSLLDRSIHSISALFYKSEQSDDENETNVCSICLSTYDEGEEICWSPNPQCSHAFHKDCIVEWLMRHKECPNCRIDYLASNDDVNENPLQDSQTRICVNTEISREQNTFVLTV